MLVAIGRMSADRDSGTPRTQSTAASKVIALASARFSPRTCGPGCGAQSCAATVGAWSLLEKSSHALQTFLVLGFGERVLHRVYGVEVGEIEFGEIVAFLRLVKNMLF